MLRTSAITLFLLACISACAPISDKFDHGVGFTGVGSEPF